MWWTREEKSYVNVWELVGVWLCYAGPYVVVVDGGEEGTEAMLVGDLRDTLIGGWRIVGLFVLCTLLCATSTDTSTAWTHTSTEWKSR